MNNTDRLELFEDNKKIAYSLAWKYCSGSNREDLQQEALIALWIATEKFDPDRSEVFGAYAYWVVKTTLHNKTRSKRGTRKNDDALPEERVPLNIDNIPEGLLPTVLQDTRDVEIERAVSSLPVPIGEALALKLEGKSLREIGNTLRISHTKVSILLRKATELLNKRYGEDNNV